jgi:hypothetical protein
MKIDRGALAFILALAVVSSCAETGEWQNSKVPEESWSRQKEECQRIARKRAEEDFAMVEQSSRGARNSRTGTYLDQMDRFEAGRRRDDLFENCMTQHGYSRAPPAEK